MAEAKNLISKAGWLTAEEAAEKMGFKVPFFKKNVSKHIGKRLGQYKYYTEQDLERWLKDQMNANI